MGRAAEAFGRSEIEGLIDASDAPIIRGRSKGLSRGLDVKNVGAADLVVAHNAREKHRLWPSPSSSATDEIVCIAQRYTQLSQTSTMRTLLATSEPPKRIRTSRSRMRGDESRHRRR